MAGEPDGRQPRRLVLALALVAVIAAAAAWLLVDRVTAVELRLRLEPGRSYSFHKEDSFSGTGEGIDQVQSVAVDYTFHVRERDAEGNMGVDVACDAVRVAEGEAGHPAPEGSEEPDRVRALAVVLERDFAMRLSPRGRVLDVAFPAGAEQDVSVELWGGAVRRILEDSLAVYPPGAVHVGDAWPRGAAGEDAARATKLRLAGLTEETAHVEFSGRASAAGEGGLPAGGLVVDRTAGGAIELDRRSGLIRSSVLTYRLTVRLGQADETAVTITSTTRMSEER
jgi:hypothetical protein